VNLLAVPVFFISHYPEVQAAIQGLMILLYRLLERLETT